MSTTTTTTPKVVLTGATGKLGTLILTQLLKSIPPSDIGLSTRHPAKLSHLSSAGHRVLPGSYDDITPLTASFAGADIVLIVSSNDRTGSGLAHHATAIKACKDAGVKKVYYTSHQGASPTSEFWPARDHAATEKILAESGLEWVSLRNGFYMDIGIMYVSSAEATGEVTAPADGKVSWTAHSDLAEATAKLIIADYTGNPLNQVGEKKGDKGRIVVLASPQSMDMADIAQVYSQIKWKDIKRNPKDWEEYRKEAIAKGIPDFRVDMMREFCVAAAAGDFKSNDDETLKELLGREPITVREILEAK